MAGLGGNRPAKRRGYRIGNLSAAERRKVAQEISAARTPAAGNTGTGGGVNIAPVHNPQWPQPQAGVGGGASINRKAVGQDRHSRAGGGNLGDQLQGRVASGAITLEQAQRTARERDQMQAAYGKNWRSHVFGTDVGALRSGLAGKQAGNSRWGGAYKLTMEARKKMLERAKRKTGGAVDSGSAVE